MWQVIGAVFAYNHFVEGLSFGRAVAMTILTVTFMFSLFLFVTLLFAFPSWWTFGTVVALYWFIFRVASYGEGRAAFLMILLVIGMLAVMVANAPQSPEPLEMDTPIESVGGNPKMKMGRGR